MPNIDDIFEKYKTDGNAELLSEIERIIQDKNSEGLWDKGIQNESQNLLAVLLYEYSSSIQSLTSGRIKAIDVVNKLASEMGIFRFGDYQIDQSKGIDDSFVLYDGNPVTSEQYKIATRVDSDFGAHAPTYVDSDGKIKCAVVLFDNRQNFVDSTGISHTLKGIDLQNLSDIRGTIFHEWTHVMEKCIVQASELTSDDIVHIDGDSKYINAMVDNSQSMQDFENYIANVDNLISSNATITFGGISTIEINQNKNPHNRIMHNLISEGATEYIARLVTEMVGDNVKHPDRYETQVDIIRKIFESQGIDEALTTYFTEPHKLISKLESMKVKDTDMLHYLSDFVNLVPDVKGTVKEELRHNGVHDENIIKANLKRLFAQLSGFWRNNPNATEQDNMRMVNSLIAQLGGHVSRQTHDLIVREVGYPAYKQECDSILESAFPKRDRSEIQFFHDQKLDGFYQDIKTGRYSISEQQIGKATVNASTTQKSNAQNQITRDEQEIDKGEIKESRMLNNR